MRPLYRVVEEYNLKQKKKDRSPSQLYVVSCNGLFKIGVTKDIERRIKTLQTGNAHEIKLEYIEERNQPYKIERYLHRVFDKHRIKGEWFEGISLRDIRVQILMCHDYD